MLKVTKNQAFTLFLKNKLLEKPKGVQTKPTPSAFLELNNIVLMKWREKNLNNSLCIFGVSK